MNSVSPQVSILDRVHDCVSLHHGGEADVYGVVADGKELVLKWYTQGTRFDETVIKALEHLNISGLYRIRESGVRENTAYLLYDFVQGLNSAEAPRIPVAVALVLLRDLVRTSEALASKDIHHGDLNPANVILCPSKDSLQTVLIDCGIVGPGVLAYAAPERFQGKPASVKSDWFSIGLILFRWIAGRDLLEASDFDAFAAKASAIDFLNVTDLLYETGDFSAQELSALAPLWTALLRSSPEERVEDFDELDELLEIALSALEMGEVRVRTLSQNFSNQLFDEKTGQKIPSSILDGEKTALPYRKVGSRPQKNLRKIAVLGAFGLILLLMALWFAFGTKSPDIDATGNLLLEKSRSLESVDTEEDILRGVP